jgi:hypothetical protein
MKVHIFVFIVLICAVFVLIILETKNSKLWNWYCPECSNNWSGQWQKVLNRKKCPTVPATAAVKAGDELFSFALCD